MKELLLKAKVKYQSKRDELITHRNKLESSIQTINDFLAKVKSNEKASALMLEKGLNPSTVYDVHTIFSSLFIDDLSKVSTEDYEANYNEYKSIIDKIVEFKKDQRSEQEAKLREYVNEGI